MGSDEEVVGVVILVLAGLVERLEALGEVAVGAVPDELWALSSLTDCACCPQT